MRSHPVLGISILHIRFPSSTAAKAFCTKSPGQHLHFADKKAEMTEILYGSDVIIGCITLQWNFYFRSYDPSTFTPA